MKYVFTLTILFFYILSFGQITKRPLTHHMSEEDQKLKHLIGKDFTPTDPPEGVVRSISEFDQSEAVLISYNGGFGIPTTFIGVLAEEINVITIVANQSQQNTVLNLFLSNGVDTSNCDFLIAPIDSYWVRDYGPWFIRYDDKIGVVDFPYNRPQRPNDDEIPVFVAEYLELELFGMSVIQTGGNYMTDGIGIASATDLVVEENSTLSIQQIDDYMNDFLGIDIYHKNEDPLGDYIKHIDCWGKFLDVDKILIGQVPSSDYRYDDFEAVANYYDGRNCPWGTPYQVYRIYTPGTYPNTPYTNSLILNNRVFVPLTGSQWDDEAITTYQDAMPGYEIIGINSSDWLNTDALHCRTHEVADRNMILIVHTPIHGDVLIADEYIVEAEITAFGNTILISDSLLVYYKINDEEYQTEKLSVISKNSYTATLTGIENHDTVDYYISTKSLNDKKINHPYIGRYDPHQFIVYDPTLTDNIASNNELHFLCIPNPFNKYIDFSFTLSKSSDVSLTIYDMHGQIIKTMMNENLDEGVHTKRWEAEAIHNGMYIVILSVDGQFVTKKLLKTN